VSTEKPVALIIDDEPDLLSLLSISLRRMGIDSVKAPDVQSACARLKEQVFDLCLTDLRLPDGSGLDIVKFVQEQQDGTPIAVITAFGDPKTAVEALKCGAFDYISKPIETDELEHIVDTSLRVKRNKDAEKEQVTASSLLGESELIRDIRTLIEKVARNQAPVHISGETGTGKELIARLIHDTGPRYSSPFIAVNCGAIPRELMESEFFGHKKGSFTGAHQDAEGLFRAANGGTLFLDEIGELPPDLQVKLLRAIQEKKTRAVGDTSEVPFDVRLISATNRKLKDLIAAGKFREDFYYRINVIPIHAPPLRKRKSDIPVLARRIIETLSANNKKLPPEIDSESLELLCSYEYPGNVRELENILERSMALNEGQLITRSDIILPERDTAATLAGELEDYSTELTIDEHVNQVEINRIRQALQDSNGNITAAARILGTTFRSLRYRIKKLEIEFP
jgi:two-component system response regulator PilR (NtrC family)